MLNELNNIFCKPAEYASNFRYLSMENETSTAQSVGFSLLAKVTYIAQIITSIVAIPFMALAGIFTSTYELCKVDKKHAWQCLKDTVEFIGFHALSTTYSIRFVIIPTPTVKESPIIDEKIKTIEHPTIMNAYMLINLPEDLYDKKDIDVKDANYPFLSFKKRQDQIIFESSVPENSIKAKISYRIKHLFSEQDIKHREKRQSQFLNKLKSILETNLSDYYQIQIRQLDVAQKQRDEEARKFARENDAIYLSKKQTSLSSSIAI
jgi:hypothetical protein